MKRKTIIFFPIEIGIAHLTRSLAIAQELSKRKHKIIFAVPARKQKFVREAGITPHLIKSLSLSDDLSFLKKFKDFSYLTSLAKEELSLLEKYRPNCVVVDFRLTAVAASAAKQISTVFITGSGGLPYGCYLPNPGFPEVLHSITSPFIQKIVWSAKMKYLTLLAKLAQFLGSKDTEDTLFRKMVYIVPEAKSYLPPLDKRTAIHHVGPIFWEGFDHYKPSWLDEIKPDGKTIYLTFGGTGFDGDKLIDLSKALIEKGYRVVVSSSTIAKINNFPKDKNLFVSPYVSGFAISRRVDLVICHGGYGTMMQAALSGKPVVAIPFNPDQYLHALRFQELGLGKTLVHFHPSMLLNFYRSNWQAFQDSGSSVPLAKIVETVEEVLDKKDTYSRSIAKFREKISKGNSVKKSADIIEDVMKN